MRRLLCLAVLMSASTAVLAAEPAKDTMLYELRIYTAEKGKLDALNARFRDHTLKLFEKHGMTNVGYWVPIKNDENKLYYIIGHKDKAARDASFKAFGADPDWQKAYKESEKDGPLTVKGGIESILLTTTNYSPPVKAEKAKDDRVFELRTYTATKGNLENLDARFRDHTLKLFEKHGMTNLPYFHVAKGGKGEDVTLIYLLAHKSEDAAKASFDAFRKDPDWLKAREESEKKGGGSLTEKEGGVKSVFLKATDYSPTK